jgi:hypothetical protein
MLGVLDKEMRCQWLATFTGPSHQVCLFRLVFGDYVSYLDLAELIVKHIEEEKQTQKEEVLWNN